MLSEYQNNVFCPYVCFLFQRQYRLKGEEGSQSYGDWISLEIVLVLSCQRIFQVNLWCSRRICFICMVFILIALLQCVITCLFVHPFKVYKSVALVYLQSCAIITTTDFRTFSLPQKETVKPLSIISQDSPTSQL